MRWKILKRKRMFALFRNLILAEVLVYSLFLGLALSADWGELYEGFTLSNYLPLAVVEFSLLGLVQLGLIILVFAKSLPEENDIKKLAESGEHEKLEFKTSLRWDEKRNQVNRELEKTIMKTVAAFLNSEGGHLLIGVNDQGQVVGLENDLASLPKPDMDGFQNHFNNLFSHMIGAEFRRWVKLIFSRVDGKMVCWAKIEPGHKPVYLKTEKGEDFYIRTGNVTAPLKMSEAAAYISSWWKLK
ncbi:MAG: AAA ATPase [Parcubacteria group bacterium Gr01-1014_44]|nr:MAG: AAA ATPase [Parcubacteria group bacterium Gr01-1014_44]